MQAVQWLVRVPVTVPNVYGEGVAAFGPFMDVKLRVEGAVTEELDRIWGQPINGMRDGWAMQLQLSDPCLALEACLGVASPHGCDIFDKLPHSVYMDRGDVLALKQWG